MSNQFLLKAIISATDKLSPVLKSIQQATAQTARALSGVGQAMGNLGAASVPLMAVGGAAAIVGKSMLDNTAAFEKYSLVLETLEGSQQKAKASMGWISEFAAKTPYELAQVTESFVKLKSSGIDPIKGQTLRVLGDTAAAMGKDVNQAVEALADAVTGENERLKEFGITASKSGAAILYSFTDKQGKQRVAKARADNREQIRLTLMGIWNDKYGGAMDKLSGSWTGLMSNMKDQFARFSLMIMQSGAFDWLKNRLGGALEHINRLAESGELKRLAETIGRDLLAALKEGWQALKEVGAAVVWLKDAFGGWGNLVKATAALAVAPFVLALGQLVWSVAALTRVLLVNTVTVKAAGLAWSWMRGQAVASMLAMTVRAPMAAAAVGSIGVAVKAAAVALGSLAAVATAAFVGWKIGELINGKINEIIKATTGSDSLGSWVYDKTHRDDAAQPITLADVNTQRRARGAREWTPAEWAQRGGRPDLIGSAKPAKVEGAIKVEFANAPPGMRVAQDKQAGGVAINPSVGYRPQLLTGG
ncbi:tape measure protein [Chitinibacteraceae bacterium HSL-7]